MFPITINIKEHDDTSQETGGARALLKTNWCGPSVHVAETGEKLKLPSCAFCAQVFENGNSVFTLKSDNTLRCEMCVSVDEDGEFDEKKFEYLADYETTVHIKQTSMYSAAGAMADSITNKVPNAIVKSLNNQTLCITNIDNRMIMIVAKAALFYAETIYQNICEQDSCNEEGCNPNLHVAFLE